MKRKMKRIGLICLLMLAVQMISAQIVEPVHWSCTQEQQGEKTVWLVRATIDAGWHLYTTSLPEDGPLPTTFTVNEEAIEAVALSEAERSYDENFAMELSYYVDSVSFVLAAEDPDAIVAVRYMACNDTQCLPPTTCVLTQSEAAGTAAASADGVAHEIGNETDNMSGGEASGNGLGWIFLMGLLGGLLAIFTPCVWPIIPMTVSFFLKKSDGSQGQHSGLRSAILYGLSIIVIYVGLGLIVTAIFGASALNEMATNAVVNLLFFALMVVFALSFFGLFELTLPESWSTRMDSRSRSTGGVLSILFMAFTLVIVSFSCTGPIIGTLLVEAAGKSLLAPTIGMLGFALALALPFSLFAMFPQMLKRMPRSGGWMQTFKVTLAFIELALSLKFFSVADMAYGWNILSRPLFIGLWALLFLLLGIYLLGVFERRWGGWVRTILAACSLGFAVYLIPGVFGAPVKAIAAFAPPMEIADKDVFYDYEEGLAYARQEGKPVLVDFTGYGCVNCRKMEAYVFADERVKERLNNYVYIVLYVDDKRDGVGEKNSAIQREVYGANAQPYYVQLDSQGNKLGEPYSFSVKVEDFLDWLEY